MPPDPRLPPLQQLVQAMDENWGMIAVAMRLSTDPRYLHAFTTIDRAFRIAKAATDPRDADPGLG
jgi:hypothetical protein